MSTIKKILIIIICFVCLFALLSVCAFADTDISYFLPFAPAKDDNYHFWDNVVGTIYGVVDEYSKFFFGLYNSIVWNIDFLFVVFILQDTQSITIVFNGFTANAKLSDSVSLYFSPMAQFYKKFGMTSNSKAFMAIFYNNNTSVQYIDFDTAVGGILRPDGGYLDLPVSEIHLQFGNPSHTLMSPSDLAYVLSQSWDIYSNNNYPQMGLYVADGNSDGYQNGYNNGYNLGYIDGLAVSDPTTYDNGYNTGYNAGYEAGITAAQRSPFDVLADSVNSIMRINIIGNISLSVFISAIAGICFLIIVIRMIKR